MNIKAVLGILLIVIGVIVSIRDNKAKNLAMNKQLELDLHYFDKTKDMSWLEACSVLNNEIPDEDVRSTTKMKLKAIRGLKHID